MLEQTCTELKIKSNEKKTKRINCLEFGLLEKRSFTEAFDMKEEKSIFHIVFDEEEAYFQITSFNSSNKKLIILYSNRHNNEEEQESRNQLIISV